MSGRFIKEKQDLTYLKWAHARSSSGTAGSFLKSESTLDGKKIYYKLSNFDSINGVVGHECINELIVDRLLTLLKVPHLEYDLINADIEVEGKLISTYLSASKDFKERGESKVALDDFYTANAFPGESHYDFCVRNGWKNYVDTMIAVDYIILNRDRHGANIEVLRNRRAHTMRIAPLFDHGLSLLYSCFSEEEVEKFDIMEDRRCQSFVGGFSCLKNLKLIEDKHRVFSGRLARDDRAYILGDLDVVLPKVYLDKIWDMIFERYKRYESL